MERRDFIKSGLLAAAVGAIKGPKAIAQEAENRAMKEQQAKDILNYNPQMRYRPMGRTGVNVSALGFGMLRLPMKNGHVDFDQTTPMVRRATMVRRASEGGVNYIDTGRVYLGGESEQAVGKALAGGWRDRVYVTSKMPWWELQSADDFEKFFDQSRRAIGTDVIDFYHIHMIMHRAWKDYILPYRLIEKMENLKAQGKIRFMGFSFHDSLQLFKKVVEYTPAWDFCLIQHNYLDYEYEAGALGPKYAAANGMGLAVMKPVRTGFLAHLPQSMKEALASTSIHKPDAEWALDYLWDIPEVSVAVSGMGSMAEVEENLKYAAKAQPNMLTPAEREALGAAIYAYRHSPGHKCGHRLHFRLRVQQLPPPPKQGAGHGRLHRLHVACAAWRPGLVLCKLWRMFSQMPTASGYTGLIGQSKGNDGQISLRALRFYTGTGKCNTPHLGSRRLHRYGCRTLTWKGCKIIGLKTAYYILH